MIVIVYYYSSSTVYSILPVLVTTLIPVIHCALHLMIFLIFGLYPSYLILIHNSNCDNRVIPHLLTISIVASRICPSIHPSIHPYSCLLPIRRHWCSCFPLRTTLAPSSLIGMVMSVLRRAIFAPSTNLLGPLP